MISQVNRHGIAMMIAAMACYVLNDTLVKLTLHAFAPGQILAVRGLAAGAVLALVSRPQSRLSQVGGLHWPILTLRCVLEIATATASVLALRHASLTLVSATMMTAPLLIATASIALRWEPVRAVRLITLAVGFVGALVVLRPSSHATGAGAAFAGLCALSMAARDLVTRRMPPSISSSTAAVATTFAVCLSGPVLGWTMHETWRSLARPETGALAGAALCTALGNYALIAACRRADLSVVVPFRYTMIVWASVAGYFVWGDVPDAVSLGGIALIAAGGIFTLRAARQAR